MTERDGTAAAIHLIVGVTGHRRLRADEVPSLRLQVHEVLATLAARYPELPLLVLSPLAEGADRLVAEVAFERGLRVVAPLPLPLAQYRDDFADDASRAELERQIARAEVIELPRSEWASGRRATDTDPSAVPGPARDQRYAQAGMFVSRHCHVLLALWDGLDGGSTGGTAQVVRYHLGGEIPGALPRPPRASLTLLGIGEDTVVRHIAASRSDAPSRAASRGGWLTMDDAVIEHDALPPAFDAMFRRQAEYNADARRYADDVAADAPADSDGAAACPIHRQFVVADWLARTYQRRVARVLRLTYAIAAATGAAFIVYAHVKSQDALIYLYLALFIAGVGLAVLARRRAWHRKYLDYRALAEGLRVQSYWRRAGVVDAAHPSVDHDSFMQEQDLELGWIRNALRSASLDGLLVPVAADASAVERVVGEWVGTPDSRGQLGYFTAAARSRERQHRRAEWLAHACLGIGITISLVLALFAHRWGYDTKNALVVLMGLLSVGAGVHEAYAHKKADKELVKQYRFMQRIYAGARRRLDGATTPDDTRRILRTLGEAALAEHAEWTLMHRERPLEHTRLGG
ncbi:hypothetical protein [Cognatilysobacter tabacisoli]|uniref:hypothetical protein n=1 Tax=Cognatilysobacter tabacisoli TaxID=2315424 RepID=UPI000E6B0792|nr:hypothetical protein [Lysobacter tabacisoli]